MNEENNEQENKWCIWVNASKKTVHLKEVPNAKKMVFKSDEARVEFAAKLVFKGFSIG